ncbi:YIP1 family protein [Methanosarcina hadiensis]|uniref:YIP1 family protein n=1 Tax=Methanosarcina hadiensis TaxID=3078083 RepID=UPI00397796DE
MPTTGAYNEPLTFVAINYLIFGFLTVLFDPEIMEGLYDSAVEFSLIAIFMTVFMIVLGIISTFFGAAIYDAIYKLLGGTGDYRGTVRFISYTSSVLAFAWIPVIGWFLQLYGIYLYIVGGKFVHNVSMEKSAIAIFLPILFIIIIGAIGALAA